MLEFIGLLTCIYLAVRLFPMVIKSGIKLAVLILLMIFVFLCVQIIYFMYFGNMTILIA